MDSTQQKTEAVIAEVWIPLRGYQLTLKHKLLSELGEISHFILKALHQTPLTLDDFELITGLSNQQLNPVWKRLEGLRFIEQQGQLTPHGKSIAYILKHIHHKTVYFWLDRRYRDEKIAMLMIKGDSALVNNKLPKEAIKIEPKSLERDWNTDCFSQIERIRKDISAVLPWLFPVFKQLPNIEAMKWGQEWDLELQVDKNFSEGYGLPIELEFISQTDKKKSVISLFTKVLALETHFELVHGIDFGQSLECPQTFKFQYSFAEESFYRDLPYVDNADSDKILECLEDTKDKEIAIGLLNLCHEKTDGYHSMFNRLHKFYTVWQQHDASWPQVCKYIPKMDDIYQTYTSGE